MRMPRFSTVLVGTAVAVVTLTGTTGPAGAQSASAVGGAELDRAGVVVRAGTTAPPAVAAEGWLVADLDTGAVLAAKNAHGRFAPASTLKTLTALALLPELPPDRRVRASFDDIAVDGSKVGIVERVDYPVSELFSSLLMVSGNDAANVLASAAGGQARTAELMNAKAASLQALDTHAVNPHGLDAAGQVSSPYDLALIARAGLDDPDFTRYVQTRSSSISAPNGTRIQIGNKNKLLHRYPGALGVKNGFTTAARASFVGAAGRDGRRLVVTLMKADPRVFDEAVKLLDWGFAARRAAPVGVLVDPGDDARGTRDRSLPAGAGLSGVAGSSQAASVRERGQPDGAQPARDPGLPVTLAGIALGAAALLAVRARPATARRTSRRGTGRSASGRRAPSRRPQRRTPARRR